MTDSQLGTDRASEINGLVQRYGDDRVASAVCRHEGDVIADSILQAAIATKRQVSDAITALAAECERMRAIAPRIAAIKDRLGVLSLSEVGTDGLEDIDEHLEAIFGAIAPAPPAATSEEGMT